MDWNHIKWNRFLWPSLDVEHSCVNSLMSLRYEHDNTCKELKIRWSCLGVFILFYFIFLQLWTRIRILKGPTRPPSPQLFCACYFLVDRGHSVIARDYSEVSQRPILIFFFKFSTGFKLQELVLNSETGFYGELHDLSKNTLKSWFVLLIFIGCSEQ